MTRDEGYDNMATVTADSAANLLEPIYLLYDERMLLHRPVDWTEPLSFPKNQDEIEEGYPIENPERLQVIYDRLCILEDRLVEQLQDSDDYEGYAGTGDSSLLPTASTAKNAKQRTIFEHISCSMATKEEVLLAHSERHYNRLDQLEFYTNEELAVMSKDSTKDIYYCRDSFKAARLAAGGLLSCIDAICSPIIMNSSGMSLQPHYQPSNMNKAIALVRPPGHHACQSEEMGFCFIDSVVVAAKYALKNKKAKIKRIVILDWDIHDGNATADGTIKDSHIFRIDLHRYNPKCPFYPFTGSPHEVGSGTAEGLNLNMTWSQGGMGNIEYGAAFYELILPLIADYKPDLLIISCGLDAAMGDLLGDCNLTPSFFHAMTRAAIEVIGPNTPVLCALEGGYTINVIPDCMEAVTLAMLNLPYSYHSSQQQTPQRYCGGGGGGGAAGGLSPVSSSRSQPWSYVDGLKRSRFALRNYYVRLERNPLQIAKSAIQDINQLIRTFHGLQRWKHLPLKRIKSAGGHKPLSSSTSVHNHRQQTPPKASSQKRNWNDIVKSELTIHQQHHEPTSMMYDVALVSSQFPSRYSRKRMYLWYGTEKHHHIQKRRRSLYSYS